MLRIRLSCHIIRSALFAPSLSAARFCVGILSREVALWPPRVIVLRMASLLGSLLYIRCLAALALWTKGLAEKPANDCDRTELAVAEGAGFTDAAAAPPGIVGFGLPAHGCRCGRGALEPLVLPCQPVRQPEHEAQAFGATALQGRETAQEIPVPAQGPSVESAGSIHLQQSNAWPLSAKTNTRRFKSVLCARDQRRALPWAWGAAP